MSAQVETWNVDADGLWNVDANWTPNPGFPNSQDATAIFGSAITGDHAVSVTVPITVGTINFDNGNNYNIAASGGTLTFNVSSGNAAITITNVNGNGGHDILTPITLNNSLVLSLGSLTPFDLSSVITGGASAGMTITGTGPSAATNTVILSGASSGTFLGGITLTTGVIQCGTVNTLSSGPLIITGGTLNLMGFNQTVGALSGAGLIALDSATLTTNTSGATPTTYSGLITEIGGLTVGGTGTLILTGENDYDGTTLITGTATLQGSVATLPGAITDNATLIFDQGTNAIFESVVSGSGTLIKQNSGTLTLGVASTYGGGTTINGGTLQNGILNAVPSTGSMTVNGGGIWDLNNFTQTTGSISGGGNIINLGAGHTLTSVGTVSSTFSGQLSGAGSFIYSPTGAPIVLTFNGTNTYTGGTTVTQGVLQTGATNTLPVNGNLAMNGGTLLMTVGPTSFNQTVGTLSGTTGAINLGTAQLTANATGSATYGGVMSGAGGSFVYAGSSPAVVLNLTNNSTFTGGTFINSGTLQDGIVNALATTGNVTVNAPGIWNLNNNNQTIGALAGSGNVTLGTAILTTGNGTTTTYSGVMSGAGHLTKQGAGTLILSGANTYSAGTNVSAGVLQGDTTSLQGVIVNNATLNFNQSFSGTYASTISGTGTLLKNGSGTVTFTGANNQVSTQINGGTLLIGGGSTLTSTTLTVGSSGTLAGIGTVTAPGGVLNQGIVQPGISIGTLTIVGNYTQAPGSTLSIELSPTTSSLLNVLGGNVTIQSPSTVVIMPQPGNYSPSMLYTLVSVPAGTVSGTYSSLVAVTNPFFSGTLIYNNPIPGSVQLQLGIVPFNTIITGGNAGAVAKCINAAALEASSDLLNIIQGLIFLPVEQVADALNLMQPSQLRALTLTEENNLLLVRTAISQRTQTLYQTLCERYSSNDYHTSVWGNVSGDFVNQQKQQQNVGYQAWTGSVTFGADGRVGKHFILGASGAVNRSNVDWKKSRGDGMIKSYYAGPYLTLYGESGFLNLSAVGTYNNYHSTRHIKFSGVDRKAKSTHSGYGGIGHLDIGGIFYARKNLTISPMGGVDYVHLFEKGFKEKDADSLNLKVNSSKADLLRSELGLKIARCVPYEMATIAHDLKLSWIHEKRMHGEHLTAGFADQNSCHFTVEGMQPNRDLFNVATGFNAMFRNDKISFSLRYEGEFASHYSDQSAYIQLLVRI
jgi:autotransporter-associated beta strand protein